MEDNHSISSRSRSAANIVTNNGSDLHGGHTGSYDSYFKSLPPGYRFKPTDEELVVSYLKKRIKDEPLPPNRINDIDLYKYDPEMLAEKYKSDGENMTWYFFTPRDKKYPNGIRPKRSVEDRDVKYGFWKATGADKPVMFKDVQVGCKTSLVYHTGNPPNGPKTDWKMHEFKIPKPEDNERPRKKAKKNADPSKRPNKIDMRLDDWVLCRVFKKLQSLKASEHSNDNGVEIQEQRTDGSSSQDNGNVFDELDAPLANAYQQNHLLSNQDGYNSCYQSGFVNQNDMPIGYGGAFMAESLPGAILPYHNPHDQFNGSLKRKRSFCDLPSELDQYPNYVEWLIDAADNDLTTNFP